jgi:hypothetical protein
MLLAFHSRVDTALKIFNQVDSNSHNQLLVDLKDNLLSASELPTTSKMAKLHSFLTVMKHHTHGRIYTYAFYFSRFYHWIFP